MGSFNNITILGNLTSDPEAGQMPDGTPTSRFGIAVNTRVKGEEVPTFFRVNYIGRVADVANQFLAKGRQALVLGELRLETYPKKDGTQGTSLEVRGTTLQLIGAKPQAAAAGAGAAAGVGASAEDDGPPF
jgi:single-strand DNA-binding protein